MAKYEFRPATAELISKLDAGYRRVPEHEQRFLFGEIIPTSKFTEHRPTPEKMRLAVKDLVEYRDTHTDTPFHLVALKVARSLGTLTRFGGDPIIRWRELARSLRSVFKPFPPDKAIWSLPKGHVGVYLIPDTDSKPVLTLRPDSLSNALKLYAAHMVVAGTTSNICQNCKAQFLSGGSRDRRKKRADATFCSDECRWKFHNEARRKAR